MLFALLCAVVLAPVYWWVVPGRWRREALLAGSLAGLAVLDPRLPVLVLVVTLGLHAGVAAIGSGRLADPRWIVVPGVALLVSLFTFNKLGGAGGLLPSQDGLVFLGVSYLVLKAAAALIDASRGELAQASFVDLLAWIVFLPTYTSGPIEEFEHFRGQTPRPSSSQVMAGLERILFGLVKTLLLSHYLGVWLTPILADPAAHGPGTLLLTAYATTLRFYFDFAGYTDIAIGVSALFGMRIQENFDNPLVRRNLTQLWRRWHMTLTRWLRRYLFVPISRKLMRAGGESFEVVAIGVAQLLTMTFCGVWHGFGWNFVVWGFLQGLGMLWVAVPARALGNRLPAGLRSFWRDTRPGYAMSTLVTFHYFSFANILAFTGLDRAVTYASHLLGVA
jgi:alginate O-acetyltransferase complex protein AlgI